MFFIVIITNLYESLETVFLVDGCFQPALTINVSVVVTFKYSNTLDVKSSTNDFYLWVVCYLWTPLALEKTLQMKTFDPVVHCMCEDHWPSNTLVPYLWRPLTPVLCGQSHHWHQGSRVQTTGRDWPKSLFPSHTPYDLKHTNCLSCCFKSSSYNKQQFPWQHL